MFDRFLFESELRVEKILERQVLLDPWEFPQFDNSWYQQGLGIRE